MNQNDVEEKAEAIFKVLDGMPLSDAERILHECTDKLHEHCVISKRMTENQSCSFRNSSGEGRT